MNDITRWEAADNSSRPLGYWASRQVSRVERSAELEIRQAGIAAGISEFRASLGYQRELNRQAREDEMKRNRTIYQGRRAEEAGTIAISVHDQFAALTQGDRGRAAILAPLEAELGRCLARNLE